MFMLGATLVISKLVRNTTSNRVRGRNCNVVNSCDNLDEKKTHAIKMLNKWYRVGTGPINFTVWAVIALIILYSE